MNSVKNTNENIVKRRAIADALDKVVYNRDGTKWGGGRMQSNVLAVTVTMHGQWALATYLHWASKFLSGSSAKLEIRFDL